MIDFHAKKETTINASPEAVFKIVTDLKGHKELAGSGELVDVQVLTPGPTNFGSTLEADESINMGDQHFDVNAKSVTVTYDSPNTISWLSVPVVPPLPTERIQWWFRLSPEGQGTKVVHEVEVDLGGAREMMGGTETYNKVRGVDVSRGMEKTLENLKKAAER